MIPNHLERVIAMTRNQLISVEHRLALRAQYLAHLTIYYQDVAISMPIIFMFAIDAFLQLQQK